MDLRRTSDDQACQRAPGDGLSGPMAFLRRTGPKKTPRELEVAAANHVGVGLFVAEVDCRWKVFLALQGDWTCGRVAGGWTVEGEAEEGGRVVWRVSVAQGAMVKVDRAHRATRRGDADDTAEACGLAEERWAGTALEIVGDRVYPVGPCDPHVAVCRA